MLVVVLATLSTLVLAGLVLFYVAFPHRGETPPQGEWLGDALSRAVEAMPVLDEDDVTALRAERAAEPAHRG